MDTLKQKTGRHEVLADTQAATIMKTGGLLKARLDRFSMKLRLAGEYHDKLEVWRVYLVTDS